MAARNEAADTSGREILVSRTFDAPRELVFEAWSHPERIARWWGPRGFTTTTQRFDLQAGGEWRFVMHGPDGRDYKNRIVFVEVARPERLIYKHAGEEADEDVRFHTTVTFDTVGSGTRVTLRMVFDSAAERDRVAREYGAVEGGHQTLERLGEHLSAIGVADSPPREIISSRVFAASRQRVYDAFRNSDQLAKWWGPAGFTSTIRTFDLRPGGVWRFSMRGPDGTEYENEKEFVEIEAAHRISFRHHEPIHAFVMTMDYADEGTGTRLTWRMLFDSPDECARLRGLIKAANEENFDRLEQHLTKA